KILQDMARKEGKTVIIVTHNAAIAPIANRVIQMHDGKIKQIDNNSQPEDIDRIEW
ncbi:MAG: ABC transporter ATP-binding protein, partial [Lactococcus lactis]|nr:ABC transporter ATP-binding protein [Lactococcus lactis]